VKELSNCEVWGSHDGDYKINLLPSWIMITKVTNKIQLYRLIYYS